MEEGEEEEEEEVLFSHRHWHFWWSGVATLGNERHFRPIGATAAKRA